MNIQVLNKTYAIESIDFAGDTLEAIVYDIDAPTYQDSVAIKVMNMREAKAFILAEGISQEAFDDFGSWDYYITFNDQLRAAIELQFEEEIEKRRVNIIILFIWGFLVHVGAAVLLYHGSFFISPVFYMVGMLGCNWYARKTYII